MRSEAGAHADSQFLRDALADSPTAWPGRSGSPLDYCNIQQTLIGETERRIPRRCWRAGIRGQSGRHTRSVDWAGKKPVHEGIGGGTGS